MINKKFTLAYKRKREGRTDYKKRLAMLKAKKTRVVIRRSLNNLQIQFTNFDPKGDKVLVSGNSYELKKYGWNLSRGNIPASYLTGYLCGLKAKKKNIKEAILDIGLQGGGERIFAALKGLLDAGINIPHSKDIIPDEKRIQGLHIIEFAKKASGKQFSKTKSENIKNLMEETKNKISK